MNVTKQFSFAYIRGDYSPSRLPGPHDIDLAFETREDAEDARNECVESLRDLGARVDIDDYLIVERYVSDWKASIS